MGRPRNMENLFKADTVVKKHSNVKQGEMGFDNQRENIDPHVKTKAVSTKEGTIQGVPANAKDIVNKEYVDAQFPVTHASTTGQTTDDHHNKQHAINDAANHTSPLNPGQMIMANVITGLPNNATNTNVEVAGAVNHSTGDGSDHADVATNTAASHAEAHNVASHSDTTITGAETETLSDGSDADALHAHAVNDTHVAGDGSDHADVATNTAASHAQAHNVASHSDTTITGAETETLSDGSDADALHAHAVNDTHVAGDGSDHADVVLNTTHRTSTGADHTWINQDVTAAASPIFSNKIKLTALGGFAVKLVNKTGANSIRGQLVKSNTTFGINDSVILAAAGDVECIGVFLDPGIQDGRDAWIVVGGIADVAFDDNVAVVRGEWISTGVLTGYAAKATSPAAAPTHFEEIGHSIETVAAGGAGTHILARCILHFN